MKIELIPELQLLFDLYEKNGQELYLVGGCIRDLCMGNQPHDYDLTTSADPQTSMDILQDFRLIPTGLKHGTITVLINEIPFEITVFRKDGTYEDHRHPSSVSFSSSLSEDLMRRDFTINAMACHPKKGLIDENGGLQDLKKGVIRTVGDPYRRFDEDALRILRAIRFGSRFGFVIEDNTKRAILDCKDFLKDISRERIENELEEILINPYTGRYLREYRDVFAVVIPELKEIFDYDQNSPFHAYDLWEHTLITLENTPKDFILRMAALLHDIGKPDVMFIDKETGQSHYYNHALFSARKAEKILNSLKIDNLRKKEILELIAHHDDNFFSKKGMKKYLGMLKEGQYRKLIALMKADNVSKSPAYVKEDAFFDSLIQGMEKLIEEKEAVQIADLKINGNELKQLGYEGRQIGNALKYLYEKVISGEIENKKEILIQEIKKGHSMKLFEPFKIGNVEIKNRIVRSAVFEFAADKGKITDSYRQVYQELAAGGCGLIISGHTAVSMGGRVSEKMVSCAYEGYEEDIHEIAEMIHSYGGIFFVQLQHAGSKVSLADHGDGFSVSRIENNGFLYREMNDEDIAQLKDQFYNAGEKCKKAGCDGIQVHSTHGYLLNCFLSPSTNNRTDKYGGDISGRSLLLREICSGLKERLGKDYPVIVKLSYSDLIEKTSSPQEIIWLAKRLEEIGIDGLEISAGMTNDGSKESFSPFIKPNAKEGNYLAFAEDVAANVSIPVLSVCGFRSRDFCEEVLKEGKISAISLGRPLIRQPDLPNIWKEENCKSACISCNKCYKSASFDRISCHIFD